MDEQQQQRINEAVQQFADALVQSFRAVSDRTVATQEQGAQLTQEFLSRVIENLHAQAEDARQMTQQLADQQQRAAEAGRTLTGASVGAYMDFVNSMFSFYRLDKAVALLAVEPLDRSLGHMLEPTPLCLGFITTKSRPFCRAVLAS